MANITETATYDAAVPELATNTQFVGGSGGTANSQAQALANRTKYLKAERDKETSAGRALVEAADAAAQRTALGLGGSAVKNVGTSSDTVAAGDAPEAARASAVSTASADATSKANAAAAAAESYADGKDTEHLSAFTHGNIPTATGKANADGATATPTAGKAALGDANAKLDAWISDASTTTKGKVLLPNASGFAPMPLNAGVTIGPNTTGLGIGAKGMYRSDGAFTLPAGGTWEYYIEQTAMPLVQKLPGITKSLYGTEVIKHLGDNYFVTATSTLAQILFYRLSNEALTQVGSYSGTTGTTGIIVLQEWNGTNARLAVITGDDSTATVYVLVFDGTTITLESTNSLGIGLSRYYISGTALTATRIACICGSAGTNKNTLYTFDYDTSAKTWAQVGTPLALTVQYRCGMCKAHDSTTDIIIAISSNTVARYSFDGSAWTLVGTAYSLYTNHGISGNSSFCIPLEANRYLVGFLNNTAPTTGIVLWWDSLSLVFRPMTAVIKLRSTSTSYSAWGYGLSTLLSFDANEGKVYGYHFPAGELTSRFAGVGAGGTTIAPAEIATAYRGSIMRIQ